MSKFKNEFSKYKIKPEHIHESIREEVIESYQEELLNLLKAGLTKEQVKEFSKPLSEDGTELGSLSVMLEIADDMVKRVAGGSKFKQWDKNYKDEGGMNTVMVPTGKLDNVGRRFCELRAEEYAPKEAVSRSVTPKMPAPTASQGSWTTKNPQQPLFDDNGKPTQQSGKGSHRQ